MILALLTLVLAADGGGVYAMDLDFEWPVASMCTSTADWVVRTDSNAQTGYGTPGATTLVYWDGGALVDTQGLRTVRGPVNIYYRLYLGSEAWPAPDAGSGYGGGKIEVCHAPSFDPLTESVQPFDPYWSGTNYLIDAWDGSQHAVVCIYADGVAGELLCRIQNPSTHTDLIINGLSTPPGQSYCVSVEWVVQSDGHCKSWMRHDACGSTPGVACRASTIVAFDVSGSGACPGVAVYAWLGNRWSETAPTSTHVQVLRVSHLK